MRSDHRRPARAIHAPNEDGRRRRRPHKNNTLAARIVPELRSADNWLLDSAVYAREGDRHRALFAACRAIRLLRGLT